MLLSTQYLYGGYNSELDTLLLLYTLMEWVEFRMCIDTHKDEIPLGKGSTIIGYLSTSLL